MRYVGKSKINKIHPKPNTGYPLLRSPQAFNDFVGETAQIFEMNHDGKKAFLVVMDKDNDQVEQVNIQVMQPVMQDDVSDGADSSPSSRRGFFLRRIIVLPKICTQQSDIENLRIKGAA